MNKKISLRSEQDAAADRADEVSCQAEKNRTLEPVKTRIPRRKRSSKNGILALCALVLVLLVVSKGSGFLADLFSPEQVNAGTAGQTKVRVNVDSAFVNGVLDLDIRGAFAANLNHNSTSDTPGRMPACGINSNADKKPVLLPEVKPVIEAELPKEPVKQEGVVLLLQKKLQKESKAETAAKQKNKSEQKKEEQDHKIEKEKEEEVLLLSTTAGKKNEAGLRYQHNKKMVKELSEEDYTVLCRIVEAEATGEDVYGKILVANVVLNRVNHKEFPNTVKKVVFEKSGGHYQFSPTRDGRFYSVKVSKSTKEAVQRALSGEDYSGGALYFFARSLTSANKAQWFDSLDFVVKYGCHEFFG